MHIKTFGYEARWNCFERKYVFVFAVCPPDETETSKFFVRAIFNETKLCLSHHIGLPARAQQRQKKRTWNILASGTMESVGAE